MERFWEVFFNCPQCNRKTVPVKVAFSAEGNACITGFCRACRELFAFIPDLEDIKRHARVIEVAEAPQKQLPLPTFNAPDHDFLHSMRIADPDQGEPQ